MKKILPFVLCLTNYYSFSQTWTQRADIPGFIPRTGAAGFSIGTKVYIGTGSDGMAAMYKDLWEWTPGGALGTWAQMTDIPSGFAGYAPERYLAVGFSIGTKGYIGTGNNASVNSGKDMYEWNQGTNAWTKKTDISGSGRFSAVGFAIGTKGYVCTGNDGTWSKKVYEFDPTGAGSWTAKTDFAGTGRSEAAGFSIGTKGYVGTGFGGSDYNDFYEFDPTGAGTWTAKTSFPGTSRHGTIGFSIGGTVNRGYMGGGFGNPSPYYKQDFYEYNQSSNSWAAIAVYPGASNAGVMWAVGIGTASSGYVGTGQWDDGLGNYYFYYDFWEFAPSVLPIAMIYFEGENQGTKNVLQWETASENNNDYFVIERSSDARPNDEIGQANNFEEIGRVKGAGNSSAKLKYSFIDHKRNTLINYYRLKQVDYNGNFSYSKTIAINNRDSFGAINQSSISIHPNPANGHLEVQIKDLGFTNVELRIYDVLGREVLNSPTSNPLSPINIDISSLSKGIYFLKATNGREQKQIRFVKE